MRRRKPGPRDRTALPFGSAASPGRAGLVDPAFRLSRTVEPVRYLTRLTLPREGSGFSGTQTIVLVVRRPTRRITLHALGLDVVRAGCRAGGRTLRAAAIRLYPESQTVQLTFPRALPRGPARLHLTFTGALSPGLIGMFRADGVVLTQLEPADARRVFPCFDEPAFKARWHLTLDVPAGTTALGNGAVRAVDTRRATTRVRFAATPPLSSYLVALVVGPLVSSPPCQVGETVVRTWTVAGKQALTGFAQDVAREVLPRLEAYFGLPYAFGKLDQVAAPQFEAGAMENAGLVIYRESVLLIDPARAALADQKHAAEMIAHELAHQWYGNLVTMAWWDDLWLNEAFATWMGAKIVDAWQPGWRVWLDFDTGKAQAMELDALRSTHAVCREVRTAEQAGEIFDRITYGKGGAVLRMFEGYLGEDAFRRGVQAYMRAHRGANATSADLWAALEAASETPVRALARAWLGEEGFPLVSVRQRGAQLELGQARFFSQPGRARAQRWPIPIVLRFADRRGVHEQRVLLRESRAVVTLASDGEVAWLCANAGANGYFRVAYDDDARARLYRHVEALSPAERVQVVADHWAIAQAGLAEIAGFLELSARLSGEADPAVLDALVARIELLERARLPEVHRPLLRGFLGGLFAAQLRELGWDATLGEPALRTLRRAAVVRAMGLIARDPVTVAEGRDRLERLLAGDREALAHDLQGPVISMCAQAGDAALFERLIEAARSEQDPRWRRRCLVALASFESPRLASRAAAMAFDPLVPSQDVAAFVTGLLGNPSAREPCWAAMRARWPQIVERAGGPALLRQMIGAIAQLPEPHHLEQARAWFAERAIPDAEQVIAQTLERMAHNLELRARIAPAAVSWLAPLSRRTDTAQLGELRR